MEVCELSFMQKVDIENADEFAFIMHAPKYPISPLISHQNSFHFDFVLHKYLKTTRTDKECDPGFQVCQSDLIDTHKGLNLFSCGKKAYISASYICDKEDDCPDNEKSDEVHCTCKKISTQSKKSALCKAMVVNQARHICYPLYHRNSKGDCQKFFSGNSQQKAPARPQRKIHSKTVSLSKCKSHLNTSLDERLIDDLIPDCESYADEKELIELLKSSNFSACRDLNQIPCKLGHSKCYSISSVCVFSLSAQDI